MRPQPGADAATTVTRSCEDHSLVAVALPRPWVALPWLFRGYRGGVPTFGISEAAELLGVSADTGRRWVDSGKLAAERVPNGHRRVAGTDLAAFAAALGDTTESERAGALSSARNRFRGIVTRVVRDAVMAQVEIQAGPHRVVSLMSRE